MLIAHFNYILSLQESNQNKKKFQHKNAKKKYIPMNPVPMYQLPVYQVPMLNIQKGTQ